MAFTLPQFNIVFSCWRLGGLHPHYLPTLVAVPAQFYAPSRVFVLDSISGDENSVPVFQLRCPKGTDIRDDDVVEIPTGSSKFYVVQESERVHLGFTNEYFVGYVTQTGFDPTGDGFILMETSGYVLLEDGVSYIRLEPAP